MSQPSPCPRCGGARAWSGATEGASTPVLCVECGREATACANCGWEWTGLPKDPRRARRGSCISCRVVSLAGKRATQAAPLATAEATEDAVPVAFTGRPMRSRLLQRLADAGEAESDARWRSFQTFAAVAERATRRAEAVIRLESELRTIDLPVQ